MLLLMAVRTADPAVDWQKAERLARNAVRELQPDAVVSSKTVRLDSQDVSGLSHALGSGGTIDGSMRLLLIRIREGDESRLTHLRPQIERFSESAVFVLCGTCSDPAIRSRCDLRIEEARQGGRDVAAIPEGHADMLDHMRRTGDPCMRGVLRARVEGGGAPPPDLAVACRADAVLRELQRSYRSRTMEARLVACLAMAVMDCLEWSACSRYKDGPPCKENARKAKR